MDTVDSTCDNKIHAKQICYFRISYAAVLLIIEITHFVAHHPVAECRTTKFTAVRESHQLLIFFFGGGGESASLSLEGLKSLVVD